MKGWLLPLLLLLSSCEGPALFTDIAKGFVPEPEEGYETEGRFLYEGEFHDLGLEVVPPSYDFALAIDTSGDLLVHSIGTGSSCWVRDVERYQPAVWRSLEFDEARLPFVRLKDGTPTLHFADFDCEVSDVSIPEGEVVDYLPLPDDRGVLVEGRGRHVIAVSPWTETTFDLGRRVLDEEHPFRYSLLVKNGELVLYDADADPITTVGTDVADASILPDAGELMLLEADGALAAVPLGDASGETLWLADDACGLFDAGPLGGVVGYYSPCGTERLVLYRPTIGEEPGETFDLVVDAEHPRIVTRSLELEYDIETEALAAVFFRERNEEAGTGDLWAQSAGSSPYPLGEDILESWLLPAYDRDTPERATVALALGVVDDTLELLALDGEQRVVLAEGVTTIYESTTSLLLIAAGDSGSTDLMLLESRPFEDVVLREPELLLSNALAGLELTKSVVLEGVLDEAGVRRDDETDELSLFRTDADHDHTLYLLRQSHLNASFVEPVRLLEFAGTQYSFSVHVPDTVLSLVSADGPGSVLKQYWYGRAFEVTIANAVTSYFESTFPERGGLLYARTGENAGLYYAGLR